MADVRHITHRNQFQGTSKTVEWTQSRAVQAPKGWYAGRGFLRLWRVCTFPDFFFSNGVFWYILTCYFCGLNAQGGCVGPINCTNATSTAVSVSVYLWSWRFAPLYLLNAVWVSACYVMHSTCWCEKQTVEPHRARCPQKCFSGWSGCCCCLNHLLAMISFSCQRAK